MPAHPLPPSSRASPSAPNLPTDEQSRLAAAYGRRAAAVHDSWLEPAHRYLLQDRERHVLALLAREGFRSLADTRIFEVGCGTGNWLRDFVRWGATPSNVFGVDLLPDRVESACRLTAPGVTVTQGDISELAYPDASFDLVIQSTVFSSMLDPSRRLRTAAEMRRVVRARGLIVWYDFHMDNPYNRDVRAVSRGELLALFPRCTLRMQRITLAPPVTKAIAPFSTLACELLSLIPLLRTHTLAAIRPE